MNIYLVRHGIAIEPDDPRSPPEPERFLTEEGIRKTRASARGFASLGIKPAIVLSSPYVRAMQTAKIFTKALDFSENDIRQTRALLPDADPSELFTELTTIGAEDLMCFCHAPSVDELIRHATGCAQPITEMKKAGIAALSLDPAQPGSATLLWLVPPKILSAMGK